MSEPAYLRQPSLHGDTVVFVSDDDLWRGSTAGGDATRLTAGTSEPATPCLSPDGRWVAYINRDEQHPDVYLMPAEGGASRRLTWLGPDTLVRGWTPEGHILFVSTWGQPFFRNHQGFTLDPAGGLPVPLQLGQVNHLAYGPGQARVIGRNTADPARWKRYRGGTAGHLWIDAAGTGQFRRMHELPGNISSPMWLGDRIYHLSDAEGVGNLYSCRPDGSDLRRHTDHAQYYARHAHSDGRRVVYQHAGQLWLFDPASDAHRPIELRLPSARSQAARRFVPAAQNLRSARLHPAGHSLALDVRGKLFTLPHWEAAVRQLGAADGVRYRFGHWMADGRTLLAVSDASGEERLELHGDDGVRVLDWDLGHVSGLRAAPAGTRIAAANHRNQLLIGDAADGSFHVVDRSDAGRIEDLAWSAGGDWLAYSFQTSARQRAIKLCEIATRRCSLVTQPEFRDYSPSFDPQGRYLYFLSYRTFDPVYDSVQFEMSFPRAARPYLLALQAGGPPPFEAEPKGLKDSEKDDKADAAPADKPPALRVDLDGIVERVAAFPVVEARFGKLAGAGQGKVVWTVLPIEGQQGRGGHKEGAGRLEVFDFETRRADTLMDKCDDFELADDQVSLLARDGERLRAIAVGHREDRRADAGDSNTFSRKTGWIDLARVRVSIDPRAEWRQMLREVWRLQRDLFWVEDMSGVDWPAMLQRYEPLLEAVATRAELSDLIWELQGELGTSHAYESDGDHRKPPPWALGHLGADWRLVEGDESYQITRIVRGDAWDGDADSPLRAVGVEAHVGERIVAVNGQAVSRRRPPQALLVNQAGAKVELTLADASGAGMRRVLVKTLADEVPARYREWVERNRRWVHAESKGRVGYLHLPDMMADGFAEFHRYFGAECDRAALIVDLRYNRGGHVSELLLEKVARKRIAYSASRWGRVVPYPDESAAGPVVALCNEHAGSDGDIFAHAFKLMGIGPLVGTRTWGGVIGIWPRHLLVDGTETTQPEYSFWFRDVGWGVENHGTEPTIEIDNAPQDAAAGCDRQLQTALDTALQLAHAAAESPPLDRRPNLAPRPLPPRG
jgi:tricorn protease